MPAYQHQLWVKHKGIVSAFSALLAVQGCAVAPPAQEPPARTPVAFDRLVVLATAEVPKGISIAASSSSAAEGAAAGAAAGALIGITTVESMSAGILAGPLLIVSLPLVPLFAIAGAERAAAAAKDEAEISAGTVVTSKRKTDLQGELRDKIIEMLRQKNLVQVNPPLPETQLLQPAASTEQKANVKLEVGLREVGFTLANGKEKGPAYALFIKPQAKLIDADGKSVLDEMRFELRSAAHLREAWLDRERSTFGAALSNLLDQAAERVVLEMFEIYYPRLGDGVPGYFAPTPYYTLAPIYPEFTRGWVPGVPRPTPLTGDLRPQFRWQAFPRAIDLATVGEQGARFSDVQYDLRIFAVTRRKETFGNILRCYLSAGLSCESGPLYTLGAEIYRRDGLPAAEHRIEAPLKPCAYYAWTVRARFKLDGRPRTMEWTAMSRP